MITNEEFDAERLEGHQTSELIERLYDELKRLARSKMALERDDHTLQATALLHESFIRLTQGGEVPDWNSEESFIAAVTEMMRRILINYARDRNAIKRGRDWCRVSLASLDISSENSQQAFLELSDAFENLEARDPDSAQVAKLRIFAGMTVPEIVQLLGKPSRTVDRRWAFAKAWLRTGLG